jgi:hypothetical protein
VAFKKSAASAGPRVWTVAELGAFYTEHRSELLAHAIQIFLTNPLQDIASILNLAI